jgi:SAM-dependent methyltransferase
MNLLESLKAEIAKSPAPVGVEIGAHSLPVPGLDPLYVDRVVNFAGAKGKIDIQADGLALPIPTGELDYLCSSHVLEHLVNPLFGLCEWHRVLKPGGLLYLVVPDKRYTFDQPRALTPPAHMIADFLRATAIAEREHVREFIYDTDWERLQPGTKPEQMPHDRQMHFDAYLKLIELGEAIDIHFHTFTPESLNILLRESGLVGGIIPQFEVVGCAERYPSERGDGIGLLLRKTGKNATTEPPATFTFMRQPDSRPGLRLVCPATLAPLQLQSDQRLSVLGYSHSYEIKDGMPVLMPCPPIFVNRKWHRKLWRRLTLFRARLNRVLWR